jgi:phage terminase small subunit
VVDPAAVRQRMVDAIVAAIPQGLSEEMRAEWSRVAELLADDPADYLANGRYRDLILEYCIERLHARAYRSALHTVSHEIVRRRGSGETLEVAVHPFVPLLEKSLKRIAELAEMLGLTPRSMRRRQANEKVELF